MADKIKGITIEIDAKTDSFSKAMKELKKESNSVKTELKYVNSALKLDPTNTELVKQKQELLAKQIKVTEDNINKMKKAKADADEASKNGTEINQEEYRRLVREISAAEQELKGAEKELKNIEEQSKKNKTHFDALGNSAEKMNNAVKNITIGAVGAAGGLVAMGLKAAQTADDINTLAAQTGLSTDEIQKFQYASELIDVPLETLTGSMAKLTKNMASAQNGSKNIKKAFDELGVSYTDNEGKLRSNQDVFDDVIVALSQMENETQRDAYAMQIFGKSAQDLNPLIKGGADSLKELGKEAEEAGLILDEYTLKAANELNDAVDKMKATATGAFAKIGAEVAQELTPMIEPASEAIAELVSWILDNKDGVVAALAAIGTGLLAFNVVTIIQGLVSSFQAFKTAQEGATVAQWLLNAAMSANPIAIVVALIAGLVAAIVVLWNKNEGFRNAVINIWNAIVKAIESAINGICSFFTQTLPNAFNKVIDFVKTNWKSLLLLLVNPIAGAVSLLYNLNPKFKAWVDSIIKAIKDKLKGMIEVGANLVTGLWKGISDKTGWIIEQIKGFTKKVLSKIKSFFGIHSPSTETEYDGKMLVQGLAQGIKKDMSAEEALKQKCQNLSSILSEFISNYKADMDSEISGYNLWLAENPNATTEQKAAIEKAINDSKIEQKQKEIAITMTALSEQEKLTGIDSAEYKKLLTSLNNAKIELIGLQAQPGRADRFSQARYDNAESKYSLWLAENADATESEKLEKQKEMLTAQYEEQGNKVQDVNDKLWEEIQISGEASEASITLMNQLNAEKQAYIELKKAIDDVNKAKADVDTSSYYSYSRYIGQYGALLKNQGVSDAEIESAARKSSGYTGDKTIQVVNNNYGVTQDTAYSVAKRTKNTLEDVAMQGVM